MSRPSALTLQEAEEKIRLIVATGYFVSSDHCRDVSMPKRNIYNPDIVSVLEAGKVTLVEWDDDYQNHKYRVEGYDRDQDDLTVITVIFEQDNYLLIVTAF